MNSVAYLPQSKRLLDQMREVIRYKHYNLKTEQAYLYWVRFFVCWHGRDGLTRLFLYRVRSKTSGHDVSRRRRREQRAVGAQELHARAGHP